MKSFTLVFLIAILGTVLKADITPVTPLSELVDHSDVVLVGVCTGVAGDNNGVTLKVIPDRILKGIGTGATERFFVPGEVFGNPGVLKDQEVILFGVKSDQPRDWILLNIGLNQLIELAILHGDRSSGFQPLFMKSSRDSALQQAIKVIGALYARSPSPVGLEMLMPLTWSNVEAGTTAEVFKRLLSSLSADVHETGLIGTTVLGLPEAVFATDRLLRSGAANVPQQLALLEQFYSSDDPAAMKYILKWLRSSDPGVRAAATGIVAKYRSTQSAALLADALEDSEFEVRWRAIGGLSAFANNIPRNSLAPDRGPWPLRTDQTIEHSAFDRTLVGSNEKYYIQFWAAWWAENKDNIIAK